VSCFCSTRSPLVKEVTLRADVLDDQAEGMSITLGQRPTDAPELFAALLRTHVTDSYFVVAHFHYVLFGTIVFSAFAGFYFWWPKWTGKMLNERLGKLHFWLLFAGFHTTFLIQHYVGVSGMPRRLANYLPSDGFTWENQISSAGAFLLGISMLPFFYNVWITAKRSPRVDTDDPWGYGGGLEWATSCPPPRHNFHSLPRIRSERPAFDLHHSSRPRESALESRSEDKD
jgi:cytochrome c oxidase subunit I